MEMKLSQHCYGKKNKKKQNTEHLLKKKSCLLLPVTQWDHGDVYLCEYVCDLPAAGTINKCTDVIRVSQKGSPQLDVAEGTRFSLWNTCIHLHGGGGGGGGAVMQMWSENKKRAWRTQLIYSQD